jgi:hypothetical protein
MEETPSDSRIARLCGGIELLSDCQRAGTTSLDALQSGAPVTGCVDSGTRLGIVAAVGACRIFCVVGLAVCMLCDLVDASARTEFGSTNSAVAFRVVGARPIHCAATDMDASAEGSLIVALNLRGLS